MMNRLQKAQARAALKAVTRAAKRDNWKDAGPVVPSIYEGIKLPRAKHLA